MINEELIKRINELAKKSREQGLDETEKEEQAKLRKEYLQAFKANFEETLKSIKVVNPDDIKQ